MANPVYGIPVATPPAGLIVRTVTVGGADYQVVMMATDDGSLVTVGNPFPVTAASLPLPAGASTAAHQVTQTASLATLLVELQLKADLTETQPVSVATLPLPSGAATAANQTTEITSLGLISAGVNLGRFAANDVEVSGVVTYVGKTDKDAVYLVMKIDETTGVSISYATILNNGAVANYAAAWAARATLTYNTYDGAFS